MGQCISSEKEHARKDTGDENLGYWPTTAVFAISHDLEGLPYVSSTPSIVLLGPGGTEHKACKLHLVNFKAKNLASEPAYTHQLSALLQHDSLLQSTLFHISQLLEERPVPNRTMVLTASAPEGWAGKSLPLSIRVHIIGDCKLDSLGNVQVHVPALILEHIEQSAANQVTCGTSLGLASASQLAQEDRSLRLQGSIIAANAYQTDKHQRAALMLSEVPACLTLISVGGIVLAQNQLSLQLYGALEGTDMPRMKDGQIQAERDNFKEDGEGTAEAELRAEGSGLLKQLFALESIETWREMLHTVLALGMNWKGVVKMTSSLAYSPGAFCVAPAQPNPSLEGPSPVLTAANGSPRGCLNKSTDNNVKHLSQITQDDPSGEPLPCPSASTPLLHLSSNQLRTPRNQELSKSGGFPKSVEACHSSVEDKDDAEGSECFSRSDFKRDASQPIQDEHARTSANASRNSINTSFTAGKSQGRSWYRQPNHPPKLPIRSSLDLPVRSMLSSQSISTRRLSYSLMSGTSHSRLDVLLQLQQQQHQQHAPQPQAQLQRLAWSPPHQTPPRQSPDRLRRSTSLDGSALQCLPGQTSHHIPGRNDLGTLPPACTDIFKSSLFSSSSSKQAPNTSNRGLSHLRSMSARQRVAPNLLDGGSRASQLQQHVGSVAPSKRGSEGRTVFGGSGSLASGGPWLQSHPLQQLQSASPTELDESRSETHAHHPAQSPSAFWHKTSGPVFAGQQKASLCCPSSQPPPSASPSIPGGEPIQGAQQSVQHAEGPELVHFNSQDTCSLPRCTSSGSHTPTCKVQRTSSSCPGGLRQRASSPAPCLSVAEQPPGLSHAAQHHSHSSIPNAFCSHHTNQTGTALTAPCKGHSHAVGMQYQHRRSLSCGSPPSLELPSDFSAPSQQYRQEGAMHQQLSTSQQLPFSSTAAMRDLGSGLLHPQGSSHRGRGSVGGQPHSSGSTSGSQTLAPRLSPSSNDHMQRFEARMQTNMVLRPPQKLMSLLSAARDSHAKEHQLGQQKLQKQGSGQLSLSGRMPVGMHTRNMNKSHRMTAKAGDSGELASCLSCRSMGEAPPSCPHIGDPKLPLLSSQRQSMPSRCMDAPTKQGTDVVKREKPWGPEGCTAAEDAAAGPSPSVSSPAVSATLPAPRCSSRSSVQEEWDLPTRVPAKQADDALATQGSLWSRARSKGRSGNVADGASRGTSRAGSAEMSRSRSGSKAVEERGGAREGKNTAVEGASFWQGLRSRGHNNDGAYLSRGHSCKDGCTRNRKESRDLWNDGQDFLSSSSPAPAEEELMRGGAVSTSMPESPVQPDLKPCLSAAPLADSSSSPSHISPLPSSHQILSGNNTGNSIFSIVQELDVGTGQQGRESPPEPELSAAKSKSSGQAGHQVRWTPEQGAAGRHTGVSGQEHEVGSGKEQDDRNFVRHATCSAAGFEDASSVWQDMEDTAEESSEHVGEAEGQAAAKQGVEGEAVGAGARMRQAELLSEAKLKEIEIEDEGESIGSDQQSPPMPVCFHELEVRPCMDPVTRQPALLIVQKDISERAQLEMALSELTEAQLAMLSQIFPRHVIEALSIDGALTAEKIANLACSHEGVTILFLDIVGFTHMSKDVSAVEVIVFLNFLFCAFDKLLEKYQVQKVDTIGDAYLVASGILSPDEEGFRAVDTKHNHAAGAGRMLALAIEMLHTTLSVTMPNNQPARIRIGIHTGPCVTGLVGLGVPKWSCFGDTVNTAARLEQTATPCSVQISEATRDLLPFAIEALMPTGGVEMKGKGVMQTWVWRIPLEWEVAQKTGHLPDLPPMVEELRTYCFDPLSLQHSMASASHMASLTPTPNLQQLFDNPQATIAEGSESEVGQSTTQHNVGVPLSGGSDTQRQGSSLTSEAWGGNGEGATSQAQLCSSSLGLDKEQGDSDGAAAHPPSPSQPDEQSLGGHKQQGMRDFASGFGGAMQSLFQDSLQPPSSSSSSFLLPPSPMLPQTQRVRSAQPPPPAPLSSTDAAAAANPKSLSLPLPLSQHPTYPHQQKRPQGMGMPYAPNLERLHSSSMAPMPSNTSSSILASMTSGIDPTAVVLALVGQRNPRASSRHRSTRLEQGMGSRKHSTILTSGFTGLHTNQTGMHATGPAGDRRDDNHCNPSASDASDSCNNLEPPPTGSATTPLPSLASSTVIASVSPHANPRAPSPPLSPHFSSSRLAARRTASVGHAVVGSTEPAQAAPRSNPPPPPPSPHPTPPDRHAPLSSGQSLQPPTSVESLPSPPMQHHGPMLGPAAAPPPAPTPDAIPNLTKPTSSVSLPNSLPYSVPNTGNPFAARQSLTAGTADNLSSTSGVTAREGARSSMESMGPCLDPAVDQLRQPKQQQLKSARPKQLSLAAPPAPLYPATLPPSPQLHPSPKPTNQVYQVQYAGLARLLQFAADTRDTRTIPAFPQQASHRNSHSAGKDGTSSMGCESSPCCGPRRSSLTRNGSTNIGAEAGGLARASSSKDPAELPDQSFLHRSILQGSDSKQPPLSALGPSKLASRVSSVQLPLARLATMARGKLSQKPGTQNNQAR